MHLYLQKGVFLNKNVSISIWFCFPIIGNTKNRLGTCIIAPTSLDYNDMNFNWKIKFKMHLFCLFSQFSRKTQRPSTLRK